MYEKVFNPADVIWMNPVLTLRLLEFARETAKTDSELHFVVERLVDLAKTGNLLTMHHYNLLVPYQEVEALE